MASHQRRPAISASVSSTLRPSCVYCVGWELCQLAPRNPPRTLGSLTPLPQLAIAELIDNGGYDQHLRRLRRALATQVARTREAIAETFPEGTRVSDPTGGFVLWVELPPGVSAVDLHARALERAISVAPGPIFSAKQRFSNYLRISCGLPWDSRVENAIATLGHLACDLSRRTP